MTTTLMYALWDVDATALHPPGLHDHLAAVGATRLQVNVDDEPVAPGADETRPQKADGQPT